MADELVVDGKNYISSKRASEMSGYTQDYIGQLSRGAQIDAKRIGGLWFVLMDSLEQYKAKAETYKPQPPARVNVQEMESLVTFEGKDYISASRAAEITGYHQDYVGQLARGGTILSRQVGNRWYVDREGLLAHKKEKDSLLAAVQVESVGLPKKHPESAREAPEEVFEAPEFTYIQEDADLIPLAPETPRSFQKDVQEETYPVEIQRVPMRMQSRKILDHSVCVNTVKYPTFTTQSSTRYVTTAAVVFVVAIGAGVGYLSLRGGGSGSTQASRKGFVAAVPIFTDTLGGVIESLVAKELNYERPQ